MSIPRDFPVQPLHFGQEAKCKATCGECKLSWDDGIPTSMTPVPSGRCPFEAFHNEITEERDLRIAMVFIGTEGSTTYPPQHWESWRYAETDYCPEFLESELRAKGIEPDKCVTVLDFSLTDDPKPPRGYRVVYQFGAGEQSCPDCGEGTGNESERRNCPLCEGDGLLYWGEECQVVVLAPIDPNEVLSELRELVSKRDMFGHLTASDSHKALALFDSLDGHLSRSGSELPEGWNPE